MLPTSISEATSSSAGDHEQDDLDRAGDRADLLASSRESLTSSMIGLIGSGLPLAPGGVSVGADRLEVVGVVELDVERGGQRVAS